MRWLAALSVILAGAAIYLYVSLRDGSAKTPRSTVAAVADPVDDEQPATSDKPAAAPYQPKTSPGKAAPVIRSGAPSSAPSSTAPSVAPSEEPPPPKGPAELGDPDVPWTEAERQQWLWTANGRYEKGNYPRALEAALEISRRNPGSAWEQDAWRVAIKSYCAMNEPEKAQALFAKMTEPVGIEESTKGCAEWNVKLAKSP
jgi:hypothetical protein